ncbi:hypothetical protein SteCoe_13389 [Stentor coeruleus]|uniref:Uncharacterized protein n=1 Tax=Stentor coeruleus TaxID=5963 RepID=A0A1R2C8G2_9CILI|nr:hypothetical protein SteCoe_13389 [Stentor coeruleus]
MSILIPRKAEQGLQPHSSKIIHIQALNAFFDPSRAEWLDPLKETQILKNQNSISELENLKKISQKLEDSIAKLDIHLDRIKREIIMILEDHKGSLEGQGFQVSDLIEKFKEDE